MVNSLYLLFTIAELALVFVLSARVQNMSVGAARGVFLGYALLNGMVLSYYFLAFDLGTLVLAFLATSLYFGLMAVYGTTTHKDLSGWGPKLMMALFALKMCIRDRPRTDRYTSICFDVHAFFGLVLFRPH